ncbi:hypothetical protein [Halococcus sp. PRR34]|uniref:hypothetical protein n=1 Tax=Halococcus sp. PRR34 TaxID=3020830 RepID=UPI002362C05D|nr:hypothetical protein [Halococcus sp. PRR34]
MTDTTRYSLDFDPTCPTCDEPSAHRADLGVWICPYCGRLAIEYTDTLDGPVLEYLPSGDDPVECIKVLGEIATHNGPKAMLGSPFASKEDLLDLPQESTSRRWNPDRSAWTVDASAIREVKEQLRDAGWPVVDLVQRRRERRQEGG